MVKNILLWNQKADDLESWYAALGTQVLLNLSNLVPYAFVLEKGKTIYFSETIVVCDHKVNRCSQLNEYMKLISTNGQGHLLTLVQISQIQYF